MKKGKSITLLTLIVVIMACLTAMTFIRFNVGSSKYVSVLGAIETDYDISGGTAYTLTTTKDNVNVVNDDNIDDIVDTLKSRMNALGYESYSVKAIKVNDDYEIRIEARGDVDDYGDIDDTQLASDIAVVAAYGEIEFYGDTSSSPSGEDKKILEDIDVIKTAKYSGTYTSDSTTYYQVSIEFTKEGYEALSKLLEENSTYYVKIMLGDTELLSGSSALSSDYFSGRTLAITTTTEASAKQAALQIKSGGLKYEFEVSDGESISSSYGENVALYSVVAVFSLFVIAIVAFAILYKGYGLVAGLTSLLFMLLYLLMLIAVPGIKLSLGGVIGIIFALILTEDGLMITIKRIIEESQRGKMIKPSVKTGFRRSLKPIINSDVVCLVVGLLAFALGGGVITCFGAVFAIGVVLSALSTLLFSRMFMTLILSINGYKYGFLGLKKNVEANGEVL